MITLELPYPPSANHTYSYVYGRPVLTKDARTFRHQVRRIVSANGIKPLLCSLTVHVDAFPPDKRKRDIDNCLKSLLDALQHAGVFWDDSQITELHAIKHPPVLEGHVVVVISQYKGALCPESH